MKLIADVTKIHTLISFTSVERQLSNQTPRMRMFSSNDFGQYLRLWRMHALKNIQSCIHKNQQNQEKTNFYKFVPSENVRNLFTFCYLNAVLATESSLKIEKE